LTNNELRSSIGGLGVVYPIEDGIISNGDLRHISGLFASDFKYFPQEIFEYTVRTFLLIENEVVITRLMENPVEIKKLIEENTPIARLLEFEVTLK
jgi:hypothetical protein